MPSISSICPSRCSSAPMPSSASAAPFSTACANWTGVRANCAAKAAWSIPPLPNFPANSDARSDEHELAQEMGIGLRELQALLAELDGLEIGSLRVESPRDGKEENLTDYIPAKPEETPFFQCLRSETKPIAGAGSFRIAGKGTACAGALLLRRTHHEGS